MSFELIVTVKTVITIKYSFFAHQSFRKELKYSHSMEMASLFIWGRGNMESCWKTGSCWVYIENFIWVKVIPPPTVLNRICLNSSAVNYGKNRQMLCNLVKIPSSLTTLSDCISLCQLRSSLWWPKKGLNS